MSGNGKQGKTLDTGERKVGGRLVASDGRVLPLRGVRLGADARGGLARVVLEQRFVNPYAETLRVSYLVPLPADGAVVGYAFRIGDRRIIGEVDRTEAARERFETALIAALQARLDSGGAESDERLAASLRMRRNTFLQNITRARRLLAECLRRRGIDLATELS
jgi:hypothetical protein